jgi:ABC-type antimicrobial peptide transport system ATPase subunit
MSAAIQASGLGKQYRRTWALRDCSLAIPEGHVAGLVGPNGAGKTTLLRLATGMLTPTRGTITVLSQRPAAGPAQLARVGFVAQDTAVYARMTVADHLRLGAWLNPGWDDDLARQRIGSSPWTLSGAPGHCPAGSGPSSPSPWRWPSGLSCSSSTSRSPAWTRWPGGSSCRA